MKAVVVYKDNSEHARPVIEFLRDFEHQTGHELETIDPDTRDGTFFCQTYDIMQYPTIIALDDEGKLLQKWSGLPLPRIMEVSYYAR
jgi:hypothetical protein